MTSTQDNVQDAARQTQATTERAMQSRPLQWLGRGGFVGYGIVYLVIAWLALQIARGGSGKQASKSGALQEVAAQPGGKVVLWAIAVCAVALALRALVEAMWGHQRFAHAQGKRTAKRLGSVGEAGVLVALAVSSVRAATGTQSTRSSAAPASSLMTSGLGRVAVGLIGVAIVAGAGYLIWHGISKRFVEDLDLSHSSAGERRLATRLGQVGWAGMGSAYVLLGIFVVSAAITHDSKKAGGLDVALRQTAGKPYGVLLLCLVALGLALYGVFCFLQARVRDV